MSHADSPAIRELPVRKEVAIPAIAVGGIGWIGSEFAKPAFAPDPCRWCDSVPGIDRSVRASLKWEDTHAAGTASDVLDFGVLPLLVLGGDALLASQHGELRGWDEDAIIIVEAAVASAALNQLVKYSVGRERPFVHALETEGEKADTEDPDDNNLSFYSGHTALAFSLVGAAGSVAKMRGYKHAWLVWPIGGVLAATVGYLRIGADKHWFTDVATGAVVGTAVGVGLPYLLHAPPGEGPFARSSNVSAAMVGPMLAIAWTF